MLTHPAWGQVRGPTKNVLVQNVTCHTPLSITHGGGGEDCDPLLAADRTCLRILPEIAQKAFWRNRLYKWPSKRVIKET